MSEKQDLEVILKNYDEKTVKIYMKILKLQKQHQHRSTYADFRRQIVKEIEEVFE